MTIERSAVEDFLYAEAALLDEWRLPEWLELFTEDAEYHVPCLDLPAGASPDDSLFYIADDRFRLGERVKRLMKKTAHAEYPHSRTRRHIGNVRITGQSEEGITVSANFTTYRTKDGNTDMLFGRMLYQLSQHGERLRIRSKRCLLDTDGLRPFGRISIIL